MRIINVGDRVMNTWIYEIPDGYVMIDTGYPGKLKSVEKRMKRHGIRWADGTDRCESYGIHRPRGDTGRMEDFVRLAVGKRLL